VYMIQYNNTEAYDADIHSGRHSSVDCLVS